MVWKDIFVYGAEILTTFTRISGIDPPPEELTFPRVPTNHQLIEKKGINSTMNKGQQAL